MQWNKMALGGGESKHESFSMDLSAKGMDWEGDERVICGTLRWFGQVMEINDDDLLKRVCEGRIEEEGVNGTTSEMD